MMGEMEVSDIRDDGTILLVGMPGFLLVISTVLHTLPLTLSHPTSKALI